MSPDFGANLGLRTDLFPRYHHPGNPEKYQTLAVNRALEFASGLVFRYDLRRLRLKFGGIA